MKKLVLSVSMAFVVFFTYAQKLDKAEGFFEMKQLELAKNEIDKAANDAKAQSNPEFWLLHSMIYGHIWQDSALNAKYPNARQITNASFDTYRKLDPDFKAINERGSRKIVLEVIYKNSWNEGYNGHYMNKRYDSAFNYISRTVEILDLISEKKWLENRQALDTVAILFAGYSAINAKKPELGVPYMARLADMNIIEVPYVGDAKAVYAFLAEHFTETKDYPSFSKYVKTASKLFPADKDMWEEYNVRFVRQNFNLQEKLAAYEKSDAEGSLSAYEYLAYGDMFYNLEDEDKQKLDSLGLITYRTKAEDAFLKGFKKDETNGLASNSIALINYYDWEALEDKYSSNIRQMGELNRSKSAVKDPKKKVANDARIKKEVDAIKTINANIEKQQHVHADKAIEWMEKTHSILSTKEISERTEKSALAKSVDYLANLYLWKRDKSKGNNAEYDKYDALYKKYDALHGKY